jgi:phytoene dehydrogenase-like protein
MDQRCPTDPGGVTLASGEEVDVGIVVATAHPKVTFGILVESSVLPEPFLADIRRWQSRSGTVKISLALDRLPVFASHPGFEPQMHGGTIVVAESLDDIENAFQEAVSGRPSAKPFADICIPSVFDDSLAPAGHHVMSLFTQWVPCGYADAPNEAELAALCGPGDRPDGGGRPRVYRLGPAALFPASARKRFSSPAAGGSAPGRVQVSAAAASA